MHSLLFKIILCGVTVIQFHHLIFHNAPISRILIGLALSAFTPMLKTSFHSIVFCFPLSGLIFFVPKNAELPLTSAYHSPTGVRAVALFENKTFRQVFIRYSKFVIHYSTSVTQSCNTYNNNSANAPPHYNLSRINSSHNQSCHCETFSNKINQNKC